MRWQVLKVPASVSILVVDGRANMIARNTQINIQERNITFRYSVCILRDRMKAKQYEIDVILQFYPATTSYLDNIVNVPLVESRYKSAVLSHNLFLDVTNKKACVLSWDPFPLLFDCKIRHLK